MRKLMRNLSVMLILLTVGTALIAFGSTSWLDRTGVIWFSKITNIPLVIIGVLAIVAAGFVAMIGNREAT